MTHHQAVTVAADANHGTIARAVLLLRTAGREQLDVRNAGYFIAQRLNAVVLLDFSGMFFGQQLRRSLAEVRYLSLYKYTIKTKLMTNNDEDKVRSTKTHLGCLSLQLIFDEFNIDRILIRQVIKHIVCIDGRLPGLLVTKD